jgi:hypothetical protein
LRAHRAVALLAAFACAGALDAETASSAASLARLARVAELYRDAALGFACRETITYRGAETGRIEFAYIFIHDEKGRFRDFRTWRTGTTKEQRGSEVDPRDYSVPRFLESAYLWAFIFRADRQPLHEFFGLGSEVALDRPAVKIGFRPKGKVRAGLNDWTGIAWIDPATSQILKVQAWSLEAWNRKVAREADLKDAPGRPSSWVSEPYDIETIVTEFSVVKNGMRFPGKVTIDRSISTVLGGEREWPTREREVLHVVQEYSDYEFYSVRTTDEIERFVAGTGALGTRPAP